MSGASVAEAPELLLQHHLKKLKLPTVLREHEKIARQCAEGNIDHVRYLARLVELELLDREARMIDRRIKAARFPETVRNSVREAIMMKRKESSYGNRQTAP